MSSLNLRCHKKFYHNGVKQTLKELQAEFWIEDTCGNYFPVVLMSSIRTYNYPENSSLPSHRINATVPVQVCGVDYLEPL